MVHYHEILRLRSLENNISRIGVAVRGSGHTVLEIEKLADEKASAGLHVKIHVIHITRGIKIT